METELTTEQTVVFDRLMKLTLKELKAKAVENGYSDPEYLEVATKKQLATILSLPDEGVQEETQEPMPQVEPSNDPKVELPVDTVMHEVSEEKIALEPSNMVSEYGANQDPLPLPTQKALSFEHMKESGINPGVSLTADEKATGELLWSQPLVTVMVPLEAGEKAGATKTVTINGYRLEIKKNHIVKVPQSVAEVLEESLNLQLGNGNFDGEKNFRVDQNERLLNSLN